MGICHEIQIKYISCDKKYKKKTYKKLLIFSPQNENLNLLVQIKFYSIFYIYISKQKLKYLQVLTKFYWSWVGEPVFISRTEYFLKITV